METSKTCPICTKEFEGKTITCSKRCSYKKRGQDRRKNITGVKKGRLVALYRVKTNENGHSVWKFQCDCGNTTEVIYGDFMRKTKGKVRSCGCLLKRKGDESPLYTGYKGITGVYWTKLVRSADSRGLDFNLDIIYTYDLLEAQNFKCNLSGADLILGDTASIDRIDSKLGYCSGNIQWVHKDINRMKSDFEQAVFIKMCVAVAKSFK